MTNVLVLSYTLAKLSAVMCGLLLPKDTSYGFVPRDSKIVKYNNEHEKWRPYAASGTHPTFDGDTVVVDVPGLRDTPMAQTNDSAVVRNKTQHDSRSLNFPGYPNTLYYYEPPPSLYLPPPSDAIPTDYTTSAPTDEEFINRPSQDEVPQDAPDVPFQGYNYAVPETPFDDLQPPISHDDPGPVTPSSQYLPVPSPDFLDSTNGHSPPYGVTISKTPIFNGINTKQSSAVNEISIDGRQSKQRGPLHVEVTEMHCFDTPTDGRFQAVLTVKSPNENVPVFEDIHHLDNSPCVVRSDAMPPRFNTKIRISIPKGQFNACAVKDCSVSSDVVHLCVKLRFPTIARMKLAEDAVLTLQCRTQDRIAAHTKHLAIDVDNSILGRSTDVAKGGARGGLRSRVGLYRRGPRGDHTEPLPRGARVPIGELLMLRAQIEPEDGWVASRLSSVSLAGGSGGAMPLLGSDGCRLAGARALCPREPRPAPPLTHTLLIRAALFEGMRSGEEVRLSVRLVACLEASDCRTARCPFSGRSRRQTGISPTLDPSNQTLDTTSVLSFKVVLPGEETDKEEQPEHTGQINHTPLVVMLLVLSATIVCSSVLIFVKTRGRLIGSPR